MAQTVCVLLNEAAKVRLTALANDRSRPLEHILHARIVPLPGERLTVQEVGTIGNGTEGKSWMPPDRAYQTFSR